MQAPDTKPQDPTRTDIEKHSAPEQVENAADAEIFGKDKSPAARVTLTDEDVSLETGKC